VTEEAAPLDACPFCSRIADGDTTERGTYCVAFPDAYPVAPGHLLIVPLRHVTRLAQLTPSEAHELWEMGMSLCVPGNDIDGFTVGVNDGLAAGQTVAHVHLHVIPRRSGDVVDPRGGIRWVLPDRAQYWE
jgi:diadenosine tetraphosphate (Ap4A) HIT family hydrolase